MDMARLAWVASLGRLCAWVMDMPGSCLGHAGEMPGSCTVSDAATRIGCQQTHARTTLMLVCASISRRGCNLAWYRRPPSKEARCIGFELPFEHCFYNNDMDAIAEMSSRSQWGGDEAVMKTAGTENAAPFSPCYLATMRCSLSAAQRSAWVLFERGLEYHPRNTKIMNAYAKFEADVGGDPNMARELHRRAMLLDTNSGTDMHNRREKAVSAQSFGIFSPALGRVSDRSCVPKPFLWEHKHTHPFQSYQHSHSLMFGGCDVPVMVMRAKNDTRDCLCSAGGGSWAPGACACDAHGGPLSPPALPPWSAGAGQGTAPSRRGGGGTGHTEACFKGAWHGSKK
eukprot:1161122-Pelagomonas_calceolata.AAC.8